jgi:hypothetical protein
MTDGGLWATTFLSSVVGSGAVAWAVVRGMGRHLADRWLANHKAELEKELESYRDALERRRNRIDAELGHLTYVTKTQFDTEFNAIKEIFSALGKLRLSFNGLRPVVDWIPQDEQEKSKLIAARLTDFNERYNVAVEATESSFPFVPEDIYEQIEVCMKAALIEIRHIQEGGAEALSYKGYTDGEKQHQKFSTAYFTAAKLARERFKHLTIIPRAF